MSELEQEPGDTTEPVDDWAQALSKTLAASEEDIPEGGDDTSVETDEVEQEAETVQESDEDALEPLEKWSEDVKSYFRSLDKPGQQFLLDREADLEKHLTKRTQELSEVQKKYERLDDVLKPYDEVARQQGVDLTPHVSQALQYYFAFQRDPSSTIKHLIQTSNLTPEQLGLGVDENVDPSIRALQERLEKSERELAALRQGTTQSTQAEYVSQINSFKDAKDEQGDLKHPYFEQVRSLMAPLVAEGKTLEDAYKETVWAVPEFREAQEKASREKAEKEAKSKAEKARVEKLKKAREAETLPSSDTDKGNGQGDFKGWGKALQETLSKMA